MSVELKEDSRGVLLPILAQPKARRNGLTGVHDGRLRVAVTQPPEKGKANAAIVKLLAKSLGLKRSQIELVSGETSSRKLLAISGLSRDELEARIDATSARR